MKALWGKIKKSVTHAFFPTRCAYCSQVVAAHISSCSDCRKVLSPIMKSCPFCGYELSHCRCKKPRRHFQAITSVFYYDGLPKKAVQNLKFNACGDIVREMSLRLSEKVTTDFTGVPFDLVIGVPLFHKRLRERGFNQSDLLAQAMGRQLNIPFSSNVLTKDFDTEPQHDLPAPLRVGNVVGAYYVPHPEQIDGKTILLADDVFTTGATVDECARTLKIFGASAVYIATFTVTKWKKRDGKEGVK